MIDAHTHVWVLGRDYPFSPVLESVPVPKYEAPVERLLANMDAADVSAAVLVQPAAYGWDNTYLEGCLARHGRRLAGVCLVDPMAVRSAGDLNAAMEAGCSGMRLNLIDGGDAAWLFEPRPLSLISRACELEATILIQPLLHQIPAVVRLCDQFPEAEFVVDYLGPDAAQSPAAGDMIRVLADCPNVLVKLLVVAGDSALPHPYPDLVRLYREIIAAVGPQRILLGTDFPNCLEHCSYPEAIGWLAYELCPGDADFVEAADANARRLFF